MADYTQISFINNTFTKIRQTVLNALGYTPENVANKSQDLSDDSSVKYPSQAAVNDGLDTKQNLLLYDPQIGAFILDGDEYES